jgi:hypothetical protein
MFHIRREMPTNQIIGIAVTLAFVVSTAYAADEKKRPRSKKR